MSSHISDLIEKVKREFRPVEAQDIPGLWPDPRAKFWSDECVRAVAVKAFAKGALARAGDARKEARRELALELLDYYGQCSTVRMFADRIRKIAEEGE